MVSIGSIEAVLDLAPTAPGAGKSRTEEKRPAKAGDTVEVSPEAQKVSEALKAVESATGSEIRKQVVEQARQRIDEGTYRLQNVVQLVASRITHYL